MQKVYIYKTKDGRSFDHRKQAFDHERESILREILTSNVMAENDRERFIRILILKFDEIVEAFEGAEVIDPDDDD